MKVVISRFPTDHALADWAFGVALALLGAFYLAVAGPQLAPGGDNALYVILARALAAGEGLRLVHMPAAPLFVKWPPLWPLALAPLAALAPAGFAWMKRLTALLLLAALVPLYRALRAAYGVPVARLALILTLLSPPVFAYAHDIRPEMLYLLFASAALAVVLGSRPDRSHEDDQELESPGSEAPDRARTFGDRRAVILGLLVAGAYLTRSIGIALAAAVLVALVVAGRRRAAGRAALGFALLAVPWHVYTLWARVQDPSLRGYTGDLLLRDAYNPALGRIGAGELAARMSDGAWDHMRNLADIVFAGSLGDLTRLTGRSDLALVLGMALAAVYTADLVLDIAGLGRRRQVALALPLYELFYWGILLAWPWTEVKFLVPLIPLIWARLVRAGGRLLLGDPATTTAPARSAWRPALAAAGVAALIFANGRSVTDAATLERRGDLSPTWRRFREAAQWTGAHTPPGSVTITRKPEVFYLVAERPAAWIPPAGLDAPAMWARLCAMRARTVVIDALDFPGTSDLERFVAEHPADFTSIHKTASPVTEVFALDAGRCEGRTR